MFEWLGIEMVTGMKISKSIADALLKKMYNKLCLNI